MDHFCTAKITRSCEIGGLDKFKLQTTLYVKNKVNKTDILATSDCLYDESLNQSFNRFVEKDKFIQK